jgi:hypothetical protein
MLLLISLCPNRYRVYQCPQAERDANGNQGICICPPRVLAFSHCIELSNEGRHSTQTAQESKLYARCYSITSLGIHLYQNKPRFWSCTLHVLYNKRTMRHVQLFISHYFEKSQGWPHQNLLFFVMCELVLEARE